MELNRNVKFNHDEKKINIKDVLSGIVCLLFTITIVLTIANWTTILNELQGQWINVGKGALIGLSFLPVMIYFGIKIQDSSFKSPSLNQNPSLTKPTYSNKKSVPLLSSLVIASIYVIYILNHFFGNYNSNNIGQTLAIGIVLPHIILSISGLILNIIAYIKNTKGLILFTAILYSISAILFLLYSPFLIPSIILCFLAWYKRK